MTKKVLLLMLSFCLAGGRQARAHEFVLKETLSLSEVSVLVHGTSRRWQELAQDNHLKPPYTVWVGMKLKLRDPPIPYADGHQALLAMWRARFAHGAEKVAKKVVQDITETGAAREQEKAVIALKQERFAAAFDAKPQTLGKPSQGPIEEPEEVVEMRAEEASAQELLRQGKEALERKDWGAAVSLFGKSRAKNPAELPAWILEIRALRESGRKREARQVVEELLEAHPEAEGLPFLEEGASEP
jgi:tetratricopeptide (TPR) repeat protein